MSSNYLSNLKTISRWLFILIVIGLAAPAGRLIHLRLNAQTKPEVVAGRGPVPYTVTLREIIHAPNGTTRVSREIIEAVRSDGSTMTGSLGKGRTVYLSSGLQVDTNDSEHSKTTILNRKLDRTTLHRDPNSKCLNSFAGKPFTSSETLLGEDTIAGYRTVKIKSDIVTAWYALDFGCALVKDKWDFSATEVTEKELVALVAGEPDAALFDVTPDYREVPPSERVLGPNKERRTCNEGALKLLQMLDEDYKRRSATKPQ